MIFQIVIRSPSKINEAFSYCRSQATIKKNLEKITTTRVSSNHDLRVLQTYLILKMLISITQAGVGIFSKFLFVVAWDLSENASWRWDGDLINI